MKPPRSKDFCSITSDPYTQQDLVNMEAEILSCLKFEMGRPTVKTFLGRFTLFGKEDGIYEYPQVEFMSNYLAEISLVDNDCLRFLPSIVAASAVFVARFTISPFARPWSWNLQQQIGYSPSDLKDCIHAIHDLQLKRKECSFEVIKKKYSQNRFKHVSWLFCYPKIPDSYFEAPLPPDAPLPSP